MKEGPFVTHTTAAVYLPALLWVRPGSISQQPCWCRGTTVGVEEGHMTPATTGDSDLQVGRHPTQQQSNRPRQPFHTLVRKNRTDGNNQQPP